MAKKRSRTSDLIVGLTPSGDVRQRNIFALKGSDNFKEWLDKFARKKGMPVTVLVEHCLREQAKRDGFDDAPERV